MTECFIDGSNNIVARESWNDGKSNIRTRELPRNRYEGSYMNGMVSCYWTSPYQTESNGRRYDLNRNNYYLLLAKGPVENGSKDFLSLIKNLLCVNNKLL